MKLAGGQGSINETAIPVKISNELPVNKYCRRRNQVLIFLIRYFYVFLHFLVGSISELTSLQGVGSVFFLL